MENNIILYRSFVDGSNISKKESEWVKNSGFENLGISRRVNRYCLDSLICIKTFIYEHLLEPITLTILISEMNCIEKHDASKVYEELKLLIGTGVKFSIVGNETIYSRENISEAMNLVLCMFELWEAKSESIKKSNSATKIWSKKRELIERGEKPKLKSPSWFSYDDINKKYILNDLSVSVKLCFEKYLETKSMSATAKLLNKLNVKTLGSAKAWGQTSVRQVLISQSSYGLLEARTFQYDNFYPAVISKELFYLVQAEIKKRSTKNTEPIKANLKTANLLTKIAKCGVCGSSIFMHGKRKEILNGTIQDYRYLNCSSRKYHDKKCSLPSFRYKYVEAIVIVIAGLLDKMPTQNETIERVGYLQGRLMALKESKRLLESKIETLTEIISELPSDIIKEKLRTNSMELEVAGDEISEVKQEISVINQVGGREDLYKKITELSKDLTIDDNRAEFIINLSKIFDICNFNEDGSIYIQSMKNEIRVNKTKGDVKINTPEFELSVHVS